VNLPGVRALVDGRAITDSKLWTPVPRLVLGVGQAHGSAAVPTQRPGWHARHNSPIRPIAGHDGARADSRA
jgi:hypothetical protein